MHIKCLVILTYISKIEAILVFFLDMLLILLAILVFFSDMLLILLAIFSLE